MVPEYSPVMSRAISKLLPCVVPNVVLLGLTGFIAGKFLSWSRPFPVGLWLGFGLGGALIAFAMAWLADRRRVSVGLAALAAAFLIAVSSAAWLAPGAGRQPTPAEAAFVLGVGAGWALVYQLARSLPGAYPGDRRWPEELRLVSLPLLATWLFCPYLTPQFFGGTDARSYGYGMSDALAQMRAGVFPVFVGQTEFMFEGVIHPIRTAPYHHYLGIVLDLLTVRALDAVAIQHLTVIVTAMVGAVSCYLCMVLLEPPARWLAWLMAATYVSAPGMASVIYGPEMYMTFMAFAWLPTVIYANIRLVRRDDATTWELLAAGLSLVWLCHAPVGLWVTLATLALQGLRLTLGEGSPGSWRRALWGAFLFGALTAYYFWSVREVGGVTTPAPGPGASLGSFGLAVMGLAGGFRYLASGDRKWLGLTTVAALAVGPRHAIYAGWLVLIGLGAVAIVEIPRRRMPASWPVRRPEIGVALVLLSGCCVLPWCSPSGNVTALAMLQRPFPANLLPLSAGSSSIGDLQLGYALIAAFLVGIVGLFLAHSLEARLVAIVSVFLGLVLFPVPGLTRLLLSQAPDAFIALSSASAWMRQLPVMVALCAFSGFLGVVAWGRRDPRIRPMLTAFVAIGLLWSLRESEKLVISGYGAIKSTGNHLDFRRPENIPQFAYIFPGLPLSPYLVNGVTDFHVESRLLDAADPDIEHGQAVPWPDPDWQPLTATVDPLSATWLNLGPALTLAPGERRLLRFQFNEGPYNGTLILRGPGGWYREYQMPSAGFGPKSFGVDSQRPKTIALWNSSPAPQLVEMFFARSVIPPGGGAPPEFAKFAMLTYDPGQLPIRTESLVPFKAAVTLGEPAFLETLRTFIPGYTATVNGVPRPVMRSPNQKVMLKLEPGESHVEVRYSGTTTLWLMLAASATTWIALMVAGVKSWRRASCDQGSPATRHAKALAAR